MTLIGVAIPRQAIVLPLRRYLLPLLRPHRRHPLRAGTTTFRTSSLREAVMATLKDDRLQIRIDADLKLRFKKYADRRNLEMSQILEDYIRRLLSKKDEDDASGN
jgi:hypothetical protein